MKIKYYLRGLGTGILFATIVLFIAYSFRMTDAKIKERARELGMVEAGENTEKETGITNNEPESSSKLENTSSSENASSEDSSKSEDISSSEDTSSTEDDTTEPESESKEDTSGEAATDGYTEIEFTIYSGYSSYDVAKVLEEAGVIESAADFDYYLSTNGYDYKIATGVYKVKVGDSYETIAKKITN